jgi:hypothetical protein
MLATKAWPYAVTRGETSGYQAIVVPGFLGDTGQAYVLEYASKQETDEPGTVTVRDVVGATTGPLSVAYRVTEARADCYGLGGDELLEDGAGRAIRVFEGLVLRIPAERVPSIGLTEADLDAVTAVTVPAFRKLWTAGTRVDAEPSAPIFVGGGSAAGAWSTRPLNVQIAEPYAVPGSTRTARPGPPREDRDLPPVLRPAYRGPAASRPTRTRLITAVAIVCVLAALAGWHLTSSTSPSATPAATVSQLCADLRTGHDSDAYQQFSAAYRRSTTLAAFDSSLLGSGTSASCTAQTINMAGDQATLALRLANGSAESVHLDLQEQSNQWHATKMTVTR